MAAGGFAGHSLLFFGLALLIVAGGIALFTWSGDVKTQLGAGSTAGAPSLPVAYQRVPTGGAADAQFHHPRRPLGSLSSGAGGKAAGREGRAALEELQRQQKQQQQVGPAAPAAAGTTAPAQREPPANPFDLNLAGLPSSLPSGLPRVRSGGRSPSGLSPLATVDMASPAAELSTAWRQPGAAADTSLPSPRIQAGEAPALGAAALGSASAAALAADMGDRASLEVALER